MKVKIKVLLFGISLCLLTACSSQANRSRHLDQSSSDKIVFKAKKFSDAQYKNGDVPLHEYVQLIGKISKSDRADGIVKKNSRFILETKGGRYQIINDAKIAFQKNDHVIVYGEYYGFIKAMRIDKAVGEGNNIK